MILQVWRRQSDWLTSRVLLSSFKNKLFLSPLLGFSIWRLYQSVCYSVFGKRILVLSSWIFVSATGIFGHNLIKRRIRMQWNLLSLSLLNSLLNLAVCYLFLSCRKLVNTCSFCIAALLSLLPWFWFEKKKVGLP